MLKKQLRATGLFSLILILTFITIPAWADAPIAQIQSMLDKPKVLCGRFDQIKQLVGIRKPLASNGRFCIVSGKGIVWQTLQPFSNTLRLTPDEIVEIQGGQVAIQLNAEQEPEVRMINSVLFSLLGGHLDQLEKMFELEGSVHNNTWQVMLKARDPALSKAIGNIALEGGRYVNKITMQTENGDRTEIIFSATKSNDKAISAEEALFEYP